MKKIFAALAILLVAATALFADKRATMKVESLVGKVTYEVSYGEWAELKAGMVIDADSVINTGLNSTLTVLLSDGRTVNVKPMKKGKITEIASLSNNQLGVKIGSKITSSDLSDALESSKKAIQTASSRASEAKEDVEWEE